MKITWSQDYALGIELIDNQHIHFIDIINNFDDAVENDDIKNKTPFILSYLVGYAQVHFETEEAFFKMFNYEDKENHIKEHNAFRERVQKFLEQYRQNQVTKELIIDIASFLGNWLINHIQHSDKKYVDCFKKNGVV